MMVDSFLPAMREAVAKRLSEEGLSQGKIAGLLGVTQASVSLYLKSGGTVELSSCADWRSRRRTAGSTPRSSQRT